MDKHPRSCYLFLAQRYWFLARREGISSVQGKFQFKRAIYVAVVFFSPIFFFVLSLPAKDLFVMERSLPSSPPWQNCWKSPRHGCQQETLWRIWLGLASQKDEGNGFVENKGKKKKQVSRFFFCRVLLWIGKFREQKKKQKNLRPQPWNPDQNWRSDFWPFMFCFLFLSFLTYLFYGLA